MDVVKIIELLFRLKGDAYIALATLTHPVHRRYVEARLAEIDSSIEKLMTALGRTG